MNKTQTASNLKQISVAGMALLTGITLGLYFPVWYLNRTKEFNRLHSQEKLKKGICIFGIVCFSVGILISLYSGFTEGIHVLETGGEQPLTFSYLDVTANGIMLIVLIPFIRLTFKMKQMLLDHYRGYLKKDLKFSNIYLFLFLNFYLQHKINELNHANP